MQVAEVEQDWVSYVKKGQLDKAYDIYRSSVWRSFRIHLLCRQLGCVALAVLIRCFVRVEDKKRIDLTDTPI